MKKSISKRIKITKTGKVRRRSMGIDHFRSRHPRKMKRRQDLSRSIFVSDQKSIMNEAIRA